MSEHFGVRWVKRTRKPHRCEWCAQRIEVGSVASYQSGVFEGDFWAGHFHPECQAAGDSMDRRQLEDGWMPGEFSRGRTDDSPEPPQFSPDYRGRKKP